MRRWLKQRIKKVGKCLTQNSKIHFKILFSLDASASLDRRNWQRLSMVQAHNILPLPSIKKYKYSILSRAHEKV
jgi:hypothetical protein